MQHVIICQVLLDFLVKLIFGILSQFQHYLLVFLMNISVNSLLCFAEFMPVHILFYLVLYQAISPHDCLLFAILAHKGDNLIKQVFVFTLGALFGVDALICGQPCQ